jgi:hypothetical protein
MASRGGKETSASDKPDGNKILTDQRSRFRTAVDYNKAYIFPFEDALLDTYSTLISDIKRMKAHDPIPEEVHTEAEEELSRLREIMEKAGIKLYS